MIQHYKKVKIKKLKIEKEFDYRSSDKFIIIDPEGDVNTSIQKINLLRRIWFKMITTRVKMNLQQGQKDPVVIQLVNQLVNH